jgi:uncharacterized membrane protein YfcA
VIVGQLLLLAAGGFGAGVFGSLLGLGGGILIVPLLTVGFGVPFREAVGISLVCVIVTSSAAGVYLDIPRTLARHAARGVHCHGCAPGRPGGVRAAERVLAGLRRAAGLTAFSMLRRGRVQRRRLRNSRDPVEGPGPQWPPPGAASESLVDEIAGPGYRPRRLGAGAGGSLGAGILSALLGVGGGIVKVPLMHLVMGVPLKVATATSNLMIGVTAAASAVVYLVRGGIDPYIAGPTAVGVFAGAMVGSRLAARIDVRILRLLFVGVLALTAAQMALRALG